MSGTPFPDRFSGHSGLYQAYRPTYPESLFAYLASLSPTHDLALDCATGNGQAAVGLMPHFSSIVAIDASPQQLSRARPHERITYGVALAHRTPLPDRSVDLVTVASAIHWFDLPRFYEEVRRVAKPGGVLAVWGYKKPMVSPEVDRVVGRLDSDILSPYWLPQTEIAATGYEGMPFPFDRIEAPRSRMAHDWDLDHFLGFLRTWSASLIYLERTGRDPIDEVREELQEAWGEPGSEREVAWDLHMRAGRVGDR